MTYIILATLLIFALVVVGKLIRQQRQIKAMEEILYAVACDIQEVRSVTHGEPTIKLPL